VSVIVAGSANITTVIRASEKRSQMKIKLLLSFLLLIGLASAQTYTYSIFATFTTPAGGLIIDSSGNLYTFGGGGTHGDGTILKVSSKGVLTTLYNFGASSTDGKNPTGTPNRDSLGNLYGITTEGGKQHGTIFKLTTKNKESTLYEWFPYSQANFSSAPSLTMDSSGNLYGYDYENFISSGGAEIFQVTQKGVYTSLYPKAGGQFLNGGPIIRGATLYGTTDGNVEEYGSIFSLSTSGVFTNLYSFTDGDDGAYPLVKLTQNASGTLYGTTSAGGAYNAGTVFSFNPSTTELTTLYSFCALANCADGGGAGTGPVILDSAGNIYGIASGGSNGYGVVYQVTALGVETVLFSGSSTIPLGYDLVMDASGNLYGTTSDAVFKLTKK
jgi:uncharacterized repeat protein (TIGR03803 family)